MLRCYYRDAKIISKTYRLSKYPFSTSIFIATDNTFITILKYPDDITIFKEAVIMSCSFLALGV